MTTVAACPDPKTLRFGSAGWKTVSAPRDIYAGFPAKFWRNQDEASRGIWGSVVPNVEPTCINNTMHSDRYQSLLCLSRQQTPIDVQITTLDRPQSPVGTVMDIESKPHVSLIAAVQTSQSGAKEPLESFGSSRESDKHIEGNALLIDRLGNVRKLPIPSQDPNDPLNFRPREKWAVIFSCCWFCESLKSQRALAIRCIYV